MPAHECDLPKDIFGMLGGLAKVGVKENKRDVFTKEAMTYSCIFADQRKANTR